ncbi:MAG: hypothetical protein AAGA23_23560 [Pseudomonadota bacterium]
MRRPHRSPLISLIAGVWLFSVFSFCSPSYAQESPAELPFVNWENHPVRPLALSPDGRTLAATHTADNRLQLFDVSEGQPVLAGHVVVGVDPVAVQFRNNREAWVVNHISDSVSIVDVESGQVTVTLQTADEPFDVVFAGDPVRAFISSSQANLVQVFNPADLAADAVDIAIAAEDPRALAVSPDGLTVYAAVFESGNASTILGGGAANRSTISFPPNVSRNANTPSGGVTPAPNAGDGFSPALNPDLPPPPQVGTIVRKSAAGAWMDDIGGDWTAFVTGFQASQSGRDPGWDLPDRDLAIINTADLSVSYVRGLMNINMALAVNPVTGEVSVAGTDGTNELRFEPNLNGRFLRVHLARVAAAGGTPTVIDLNGHLDYQASTVGPALRAQSLGDPRGIIWNQAGTRAYVTGLGSNNLIALDENGGRVGNPVATGEGPTGIVLAEPAGLLHVWNHFEASLSTFALATLSETQRLVVFNPLPAAIREGRPLLYDTQRTSGLGHVSCASCHVDGRTDRLAWDLGDPAGEMKPFNQNCLTDVENIACDDFHPMKGPMVTQTLQDIIGHEPFHWRGDRDGIEEFNGAFVGLLGDDVLLTAAEMQQFEDHLDTITFPPNPFRNLDNTLPSNLPLPGHVTTGDFGPPNQPLPDGNAVRGLALYVGAGLDSPFQCSDCHTLPTGMSRNGPLRLLGGIGAGGSQMAMGPLGENHLGIVSVDGSSNVSIKTAQLRNMYDKVGMDAQSSESAAGFGFLHDGSIDSLARFVGQAAFDLANDQEVADLVALMLAFSGSDFGPDPSPGSVPAPQSQDTHAAVGRQLTLRGGSTPSELVELSVLAGFDRIDLVAHGQRDAWLQEGSDFSAASGETRSLATLANQATAERPITFTAVPEGLGERLALDRDGDGVSDAAELKQGSNPADRQSFSLTPAAGLWFNPDRSGHGFDLQRLGDFLFITWYTYNDDGTPTWYQASAEFTGASWAGELNRFVWQPGGGVQAQLAGEARLTFSDAQHATFSWTVDDRPGSEPFELLAASDDRTLRDYTGTWYSPDDSGWGATFFVQGDVRVAVLYFYDANNQPRWALGQSDNSASGSVSMMSFEGFCPDCERIDPTSIGAGALNLRFSGLREATLTSTTGYPQVPGSVWDRRNTAIVPLSDPYLNPAVQ